MDFGKRLRQLREDKRMSQDALAVEMGKSGKAVISTWETGRSEPSLADLRKLSSLFNVSIGWLAEGGEPTSMSPADVPAGYIMLPAEEVIKHQNEVISLQREIIKLKTDQTPSGA